ncbi:MULTISPECIES: hypothetical protein [Corallococcus]|uniref:hypothetical protein n=1 Tax=Corallococcus TaxID=83461 RepID=UPI00117C0D30|nr:MULTISPECIES: hypothetical protein [Corallococcus]NBD10458.1 hypothetical protein [Corallococcus silvisoli]TSC27665.1 hypothetical protein FOF48_19880 [Corallococcus sp. Z5C101001]
MSSEHAPPPRGLYGQRPSKSADAARRLQFERLAAMTPRERVLLALSLKERMRYITPARTEKPDPGAPR